MLQKTFGIYDDAVNALEVIVETGAHHLACWTRDSERTLAFEFFNNEDQSMNPAELFAEAKQQSELLNRNYIASQCILAHDECLVTDVALDVPYLQQHARRLFPGATEGTIETSTYNNRYFYYTLHAAVANGMRQFNSRNNYHHKYQQLASASMGANTVYLNFYPSHFTMVVKLDSFRFFVNNYQYKNAEDVLYRVLHMLHTFGYKSNDVSIRVMGLIDTDSSIYKELYAYFPKVATVMVNKNLLLGKAFNEYPSHYFSSFFNFS